MAFWPADSREDVPISSKPLKKKVKQTRWEYPFVTEGAVTATALVNKDGKFKWTHVLQDKGRFISIVDKLSIYSFFQGLRIRPRGKSTQIFPATKSPDPWMWKKSPAKSPDASVRHGSDQFSFALIIPRQTFCGKHILM